MLAGDPGRLAPAGEALLAWYDVARRNLPWRGRQDPYGVWVSEIMLQQTQVETVRRHYPRFLRRFPDLASLASAGEEDVLGAWSGLGYYRRARSLHAAARAIAEAGAWPRGANEWVRLPGVGDYTSAAIASIVDGEASAALDGNVERVTARLSASRGNPKSASVRRCLSLLASGLLCPTRPGDSNQALMELGATICRPRTAECSECPLKPWCAGAASGTPTRFPAPRPRRAAQRVERRAFVVARGGEVLLFRRPQEAATLAGFWELPWLEVDEGAHPAARLSDKYGGVWRVGEHLRRVRHAITHRRFEIDVYQATWSRRGIRERRELGWFERGELAEQAVSSLVVKAVGDQSPPPRPR